MFEIVEDTYLGECTFFCPVCGAKNYYFLGEDVRIYDRCSTCFKVMFPKPSRLRTSIIYRKLYFDYGRKVVKDAEETRKPKVYSSSYSPY